MTKLTRDLLLKIEQKLGTTVFVMWSPSDGYDIRFLSDSGNLRAFGDDLIEDVRYLNKILQTILDTWSREDLYD